MTQTVPLSDAARFAAYLAFHRDGASMSEAQWREHLKERAFVEWLRVHAPEVLDDEALA